MSQIIKVTPEQMQARGNQVQSHIEGWTTQVNQIKEHVRTLDGMWEGQGNVTFMTIWNEHEQAFVRLRDMMVQYKEAIGAAAVRYTQTDQEVSGIVGGGRR